MCITNGGFPLSIGYCMTKTWQGTWDLLTDRYSVRNNLVLQFKRDTIDQSPQLAETLFNRFGRDGELEFSRQVV